MINFLRRWVPRFVLGSIIGGTLFLITSPIFFEYSWEGRTAATWDGKRLTLHPEGIFCWEWDSNCFSVFSDKVKAHGIVAVLTPNPKVRKIEIDVEAFITSFDKFYASSRHRQLSNDGPGVDYRFDSTSDFDAVKEWNSGWEIGKLVMYQLNEFTNSSSKELAEFYNPLDQGQNQKLAQLVESRLNSGLQGDGLSVKFEKFRISF